MWVQAVTWLWLGGHTPALAQDAGTRVAEVVHPAAGRTRLGNLGALGALGAVGSLRGIGVIGTGPLNHQTVFRFDAPPGSDDPPSYDTELCVTFQTAFGAIERDLPRRGLRTRVRGRAAISILGLLLDTQGRIEDMEYYEVALDASRRLDLTEGTLPLVRDQVELETQRAIEEGLVNALWNVLRGDPMDAGEFPTGALAGWDLELQTSLDDTAETMLLLNAAGDTVTREVRERTFQIAKSSSLLEISDDSWNVEALDEAWLKARNVDKEGVVRMIEARRGAVKALRAALAPAVEDPTQPR